MKKGSRLARARKSVNQRRKDLLAGRGRVDTSEKIAGPLSWSCAVPLDPEDYFPVFTVSLSAEISPPISAFRVFLSKAQMVLIVTVAPTALPETMASP